MSVTNSTELVNPTTTALAGSATSFNLDATTAGAPLVANTSYYSAGPAECRNALVYLWSAKIVTAQAATGYAAWVTAQYPSVTGGPNADHDGDGLMNGVEYAFGQNPTSPPRPRRCRSRLRGNTADGVTFSTPANVTGVVYGAQWSRNLATWTPVTDTGSGNSHTFSVSTPGKRECFSAIKSPSSHDAELPFNNAYARLSGRILRDDRRGLLPPKARSPTTYGGTHGDTSCTSSAARRGSAVAAGQAVSGVRQATQTV